MRCELGGYKCIKCIGGKLGDLDVMSEAGMNWVGFK